MIIFGTEKLKNRDMGKYKPVFSNFILRNKLAWKFHAAAKHLPVLDDIFLLRDFKEKPLHSPEHLQASIKLIKAAKKVQDLINWFETNLKRIEELNDPEYEDYLRWLVEMKQLAKPIIDSDKILNKAIDNIRKSVDNELNN